MTLAGFSFIRNAIRYDYPIVEAIRSVLPLCDIFVVAIGQSDDGTLELIRRINDPKIRIIETVWDDSLREGGRVLAVETDKAFQAIAAEYDWCFYIQADEVIHEKDYPNIWAALKKYAADPRTEGLLFNYQHFYGSYDYTGASRKWYRREVRMIKNNKKIFSFKDAQGFRIDDNGKKRKLRVRLIDAGIYHYGWVKHPAEQQQKQLNFNKLWHSDEWVNQKIGTSDQYKYNGKEPLNRFTGTHPMVMQPRIAAVNWIFESNPALVKLTFKEKLSGWIERYTGWRPGEYQNFQLLK
jgi:hypothetical protein